MVPRFQQVEGIDFVGGWVIVVKHSSYKVLFAPSVILGWKCHQMDVKTVFLNEELLEEMYIRPPMGYLEALGMVVKLK